MSKRREIRTAGGDEGRRSGEIRRPYPSARTVPGPIRTASATVRSESSISRSAGPPHGRVLPSTAPRPSRVATKLKNVYGRASQAPAPRSAAASSSDADSASPPSRRSNMAALDVVVDEPAGLHQGVRGRRADEAEAALLEFLRQRRRLGRDRRHLRAGPWPRTLRRGEGPDQLAQRHLQRRARVRDRREDL